MMLIASMTAAIIPIQKVTPAPQWQPVVGQLAGAHGLGMASSAAYQQAVQLTGMNMHVKVTRSRVHNHRLFQKLNACCRHDIRICNRQRRYAELSYTGGAPETASPFHRTLRVAWESGGASMQTTCPSVTVILSYKLPFPTDQTG